MCEAPEHLVQGIGDVVGWPGLHGLWGGVLGRAWLSSAPTQAMPSLWGLPMCLVPKDAP